MGFPGFVVTLDPGDILTRTFMNKFGDFVANRLMTAHRDGTTGRTVWLPRNGIKMSVAVRGLDCDWPLMAVAPHPHNELVLYSNEEGQCNRNELTFLAHEYMSKLPLELYIKFNTSLVSVAMKSGVASRTNSEKMNMKHQ
jgi:hypothetical protein